jgi:hypothetical protein
MKTMHRTMYRDELSVIGLTGYIPGHRWTACARWVPRGLTVKVGRPEDNNWRDKVTCKECLHG